MAIEDYIKQGINPFSRERLEWLSVARLLPELDGVQPHIELVEGEGTARLEMWRGCRLGGAPDPIHAAAWPVGRDGPLPFVGQLDFAELWGCHSGTLPLPAAGLLSLFWADTQEFSIRYTEHGRTQREEGRQSPAISLLPRLYDGTSDVDSYRSAQRVMWGQGFQDPSWLSVACRAAGEVGGIDLSVRGLRAAEALGNNAVEIARSVADWRVLWQIDSVTDIGLDLGGDSGRLHVVIRAEDLRARRFDRAGVLFDLAS